MKGKMIKLSVIIVKRKILKLYIKMSELELQLTIILVIDYSISYADD